MSAKGFYTAQEGHVVLLSPPVNITGGFTSPAFNMGGWQHASIIISIGVSAAAPGNIQLFACPDITGNNAVALGFDLFTCETSNTDVLGTRQAIAATGYTPSANDNIFYVIEVDAGHLASLNVGYLQLRIANGANSVIASVVAVLSAGRFAGESSPTVLV